MKKLFNTVIVIICMHIFTYGQNIFDNSKSFNISNYHSSKYTFYNAINSFDYKLSINNTYIFNNKFYTPEIVFLNQYFKSFAKPGYFNNRAKYTNFSRVDFEKSCIPSFPGNNIHFHFQAHYINPACKFI